MKRLFFLAFAVCALTAISCVKEAPVQDNDSTLEESSIKDNCPKIIGIINNGDSKTTYDAEGKFSWAANDKIAVQIVNGDIYSSHVFKAASSEAQTTFSVDGEAIADGYSVGDYAFYPKNVATDESPFDLVYNNNNPASITLPAETGDYLISSNLLKMVPLIGKKTSVDGSNYTFNFCTATGILKLNFEDVPNVGNLRVDLTHSIYPLCGEFTISEDNTILSSNYVSGNTTRTLKPSGSFSTVYVALPISDGAFSEGIPAGLEIVLRRSTTGHVYSRIITNSPIKIERNTITELTVPIKAMGSTVTVTGEATAPNVSITISGEEQVAIAVGTSETNALQKLSDASWNDTTTSFAIPSSNFGGGSRHYFLAYKVKSGDHVYLKRVATKFYYMSSGMAGWIYGSYTVTNPSRASGDNGNRVDGTRGNSSFTFTSSDNPTKGNVCWTEYDGVNATNKVYGYYNAAESANKITFPRDQLWAAYFDGSRVLSNGTTADPLVFYTPESGKAYLLSKWVGLYGNSVWRSLINGSNNATSGDAINNFYGTRQ